MAVMQSKAEKIANSSNLSVLFVISSNMRIVFQYFVKLTPVSSSNSIIH